MAEINTKSLLGWQKTAGVNSAACQLLFFHLLRAGNGAGLACCRPSYNRSWWIPLALSPLWPSTSCKGAGGESSGGRLEGQVCHPYQDQLSNQGEAEEEAWGEAEGMSCSAQWPHLPLLLWGCSPQNERRILLNEPLCQRTRLARCLQLPALPQVQRACCFSPSGVEAGAPAI